MSLTVAVLHNLRREAAHPGASGEAAGLEAEYDSQETIDALCAAITAAGHRAVPVEADADCITHLRRHRPDIAFNVAEGLPGEGREAQAPAMCAVLGIPHTGSGILTLALCLDKAMAKRVLLQQGVPTPGFREIAPGEPADAGGLRFPLFVKPAREGSSMGISPRSVVHDPAELRQQVAAVHAAYNEPALVEEFLAGREFTVGLLGNGAAVRVLPITEINYGAIPAGYPPVYTYQFKKEWDEDRFYLLPAPTDADLLERLTATALAAYRAVGCADVGRIDLRLDPAGQPHVLEINPLPGMAPGFSDLPRQADAAGLGYAGLVRTILEAAMARHGL
jgi:D-alanine-D-alanine ligase